MSDPVFYRIRINILCFFPHFRRSNLLARLHILLFLKHFYFFVSSLNEQVLLFGVLSQLVDLFVFLETCLLHFQHLICTVFSESVVFVTLLLKFTLSTDFLDFNLLNFSLQTLDLIVLQVHLFLHVLLEFVLFFGVSKIFFQLVLLGQELFFDLLTLVLSQGVATLRHALSLVLLQRSDLIGQFKHSMVVLVLHQVQQVVLHLFLALLNSR